jgi:hypothetical protein
MRIQLCLVGKMHFQAVHFAAFQSFVIHPNGGWWQSISFSIQPFSGKNAFSH